MNTENINLDKIENTKLRDEIKEETKNIGLTLNIIDYNARATKEDQ